MTMQTAVEALKFLGKAPLITVSSSETFNLPFRVGSVFKVTFNSDQRDGQIPFDELVELSRSLSVQASAVLVNSLDLDSCYELARLKPIIAVTANENAASEAHLLQLFGPKIATFKSFTLRTQFRAFDLDRANEFYLVVQLIKVRKGSFDFAVTDDGKLVFAKDEPRRYLFQRLNLTDFVYRWSGQNFRLLRGNPALKRLIDLVRHGWLKCPEQTFQALLKLSTEAAVNTNNAPFIEPTLLASFAAIAETESVIERSTGKVIPATCAVRQRYERDEVLTVLEDGFVKFTPVERTHQFLRVYLPAQYRRSIGEPVDFKDYYDEFEVEEFAKIFELPRIPTIAEISPQSLKQAYDVIATIEQVIYDRTSKKLMKFQRDDLARLIAKGFGILAWDPGLGKTIASLVFALGSIMTGKAKARVLVVSPQDLVSQYLREIEKFFGKEFAEEWILVKDYADAIALRQLSKVLPKNIPLYAITWYEALRSTPAEEKEIDRKDGSICPICKSKVIKNRCSEGCFFDGATHLLKPRDAAFWLKDFVRDGVLIVDEATYAKSTDSLRGIATRRLITAKSRLLLTGTPIKNLISDLPMLLQLAAKPNSDAYPFPAESAGVTKFSKQFMVVERNLETNRRRLGPEPTNIAIAQKLLSGIILRRTKDQTGEELVPLQIKIHKVPLTKEQLQWYKAWCDDEVYERWFSKVHGRNPHPLAKLLSRLSHLIFVTSSPTSKTAIGSPVQLTEFISLPAPTDLTWKNKLILQLLEESVKEFGYCVLFAHTVSILPIFGRWLRERGIQVFSTVSQNKDGSVTSLPPFKRGEVIKRFRDYGGVLLASISAMAHGHDLAFVPRAVIHSLCFAYDSYAQAIMRVHRIVSEIPVQVHVVVCASTVDEYLLDLLARKDKANKEMLTGSLLEKSVTVSKEEWQQLWKQVVSSLDSIEVQ